MELKENKKDISQIYRYLYKLQKSGKIHRNTLKKELINSGKFSSKARFSTILESLIALGTVQADGEYVSLNPSIIQTGVLQQDGNGFFVTTNKSRKHLPVDKSIAAGFGLGEPLEIVVEFNDKKPIVTVLGRGKELVFDDKKAAKQLEKTNAAEKKEVHLRPETYIDKGNKLLGRVVKTGYDELVFIPNRKSLAIRHIPIMNEKEEQAAFQDKICVMDLDHLESPLLGGTIVEVKGDAGNPIHEYDAIAENYGARINWNDPELVEEIKQIPTSVDVTKLNLISEDDALFEKRGKTVDLRNIPFATVDPATCRDMDDAIYSTINEDGDIVCYTAVANVTKYVDLNSKIGEKYVIGAFTFYAPNQAYNILPTILSTNICSLNPNEDRLALVIKTTIDSETGEVKSSDFYDALIKSRKKYSYDDAQAITDNLKPSTSKDDLHTKLALGEELSEDEQVLMNYYTAETIKKEFTRRQMIRFNANHERDIVFDADLQDVLDIQMAPHLEYHEVIEAFMITANEATAKYSNENNIDTIFRTHAAPNSRKIERAHEFFEILGLPIPSELSAQSTIELLDYVKGSTNEDVINDFLIKMQSRAVYSDSLHPNKQQEMPEGYNDMISHYAIQSKNYSHTTSPIRRLADYVVHYNLLAKMHGTKPIKKDDISNIINILNQRQLDVDQAEKDFDDVSSVFYCEKHIGDKLKGKVTKFRYCLPSEGYEDEIVAIVRNEDKGISVEIPLSQVLGRNTQDYTISDKGCAIYDTRGNVVLTICTPLEFIIKSADRVAMTITGTTNKTLTSDSKAQKQSKGDKYYFQTYGYLNKTRPRISYQEKTQHKHRTKDE